MAITKRNDPYEVLFRFNLNGTVSAHAQKIERIIDDGVVISERVLDPVDLATAGPEFEAMIGAALAAALSERDALLAEVVALRNGTAPAASGQWLLKSTIIGRLTDDELAAAEVARAQLPLRKQVMWRDSTQIDPACEEAVQFFTALFGPSRAAEILA